MCASHILYFKSTYLNGLVKKLILQFYCSFFITHLGRVFPLSLSTLFLFPVLFYYMLILPHLVLIKTGLPHGRSCPSYLLFLLYRRL